MAESLALGLIARAEEQRSFFSLFVFGIGAPQRQGSMYIRTSDGNWMGRDASRGN